MDITLDITQADIDAALAHRADPPAGTGYAAGSHCPAARALRRSLDERGFRYEHAGCGRGVACVSPASDLLEEDRGSSNSEHSRELAEFTRAFDDSRPNPVGEAGPVPGPAAIDLSFPEL